MADAVILRWLKAPGEGFRRGEGLMEVETDKATVVYEAEEDGTLEAILVSEGETAAVGQPIAQARRPRSEPAAEPRLRRSRRTSGAASRRAPQRDAGGAADGGRARRLAPRRGRDRPRRQDHARGRAARGGDRRAAPAPARTADARGDVRVIELTPTQATIARRMAQSAAEIPSFTVSADADVSEVVALRRGARKESADAPSLNDFVVKAAALTLREFPRFNASFVDGRIEC